MRQARGEKRGRWRGGRQRRGWGCGGGGGGGVAAAAGVAAMGAAVAETAAAGAVAMAGGERPEVRVETGVPRITGNYLEQSRAVFLANGFHVYKLATIWRT